jgi:hypothetical protein
MFCVLRSRNGIGQDMEGRDMEGKDGWHGHGKESAGILNLDSDLGIGIGIGIGQGTGVGLAGTDMNQYDRHDELISTI